MDSGFAIAQELVERALRITSKEQRQPHVRRRDTVEDCRSNVGAMLTQIDKGRARPIRATVG